MKTIACVGLALIAIAGSLSAASTELEVGGAYVATSGLRRYAASRYLTENRTSSVASPQLRASIGVADNWYASIGYAYYGTLRGAGVAPSAAIFDDSGAGAQVITPFTSTEKIHEFSTGIRFRWEATPVVRVEVGPEASLFRSKATIAYRSFSSNDLRLGGAVGVSYAMSRQSSVVLTYRFANPPNRTFNIVALSFRYSL